ncbi:MAG: copper ion binding protein [Clostridiales bacterium]|jgi:copper chaperone|nr:copper ion binding protein [Clostridiales bacterium]
MPKGRGTRRITTLMMEKKVLKVDGMTCPHCVKAIKTTISALPGIKKVDANLKKKSVSLVFDSTQSSLEKIKSEIAGLGYQVVA